MSDEIKEQVQSISKKIYNTLHLKGLVRIDYIVEKDQAYLIEINTIPGLSEESIIPQQAACYGINLKQLFSLTLENMFLHD